MLCRDVALIWRLGDVSVFGEIADALLQIISLFSSLSHDLIFLI